MYEGGRIRVEQQSRSVLGVKAFDINIGNGCLDFHYGLLIRIGFNANIVRSEACDDAPGTKFPFLVLSTAQIVFLDSTTEVVPKDIKVVVEN